MPGARSMCVVVMKLTPVAMRGKSGDEHAGRRRDHMLLEKKVENGV